MMKIYSVNDPEFKPYGKIVDNVDFTQLVAALKETPVPEKTGYVPSVESLEATDTYEALTTLTYGEMPIQIGYCNGHNSRLTALEYHKDSEINVAATDAILLLGLMSEMEPGYTFDCANVKGFLVPAGTAVELYATTLHYAPCGVDGNYFQVAVVLPKGTNYPLKKEHAKLENNQDGKINEDSLLTNVNKWLLAHPDAVSGRHPGLKGKLIDLSEE